MKLSRFESMDPHLLFGLVNTELRNQAESLEDLAKTHGINVTKLTEKLAEVGYVYHAEIKQFR